MLTALFLSAHSAIAQYSGPVYTGGQASFGGKNYPYGLGTNGYGGGGPGTCTCSGGITATFTWNGGSNNTPIPDNVIVVQTSSAYWQGENIPSQPQGACDDGLNDPEVDQEQMVYGPYIYLEIGMSGGTHYTSETPTSNGNITLTCSPSANVNMNAASDASVAYSASVLPVTIALGGVTMINGKAEILPGQVCNATLQLPGGFTCSACNWSISGKNYSSWSATTLVSTAPYPVTPLSFTYSPDVSKCTSPNWYWDDTTTTNNDETVSCIAALIAPDGTKFSATFNKKVTEVVPTSTMSPVLGASHVVTYPNNTPRGIWFNLFGSNNTTGIVLTSTVIQPNEFPTPGNIAFLQTCNIGIDTTPTSNPPSLVGLDTSFPYPHVSGNITPGGLGIADGSSYIFHDSPGLEIDLYTTVNLTYDFKDYLMYLPPTNGLGSVYVPIEQMAWHWYIAANEPTTGWKDFAAITLTTDDIKAGKPVPWNTYPEWPNVVYSNP